MSLGLGDHSFSWLSLKELLDFNYSATFEDRRDVTEGHRGDMTTIRDFLGPHFFRDLSIVQTLDPNPANVRIVFGFDN